jgi:hypothetical protein
MAKKTAKSSESPNDIPASPQKRRAPARKKASAQAQAAPAFDVATVGGTEPLASAADTRASAAAGDQTSSSNNGAYQPSHEEIAQAAYFRHLNRGGGGGTDFEDWVEAERELRERNK